MKVITDFKSIALFAGICSIISAVAGAVAGILADRKLRKEDHE